MCLVHQMRCATILDYCRGGVKGLIDAGGRELGHSTWYYLV